MAQLIDKLPDVGKLADTVDPRLVVSTYAFHHAKSATAPLAWCAHSTIGLAVYALSQCCCLLCCLIPGVDCCCCCCFIAAVHFCFWCIFVGTCQALSIAGLPDPTNFFWWIHSLEKNLDKEKGDKNVKVTSASSAPRERRESSDSSSSSDDAEVNEQEEAENNE